MSIQKAYDNWSSQYDTNDNKTRDLEARALQETLAGIQFTNCLEIGCGTGKNTAWLLNKADSITSVDLSYEMLAIAKEKIRSPKVHFIQADILQKWDFIHTKYDLATFSLVLEHIEDLEQIFNKLAEVIAENGHVYIGELHPFKQYTGSKARYTTEAGEQVVSCFNHHLSDFVKASQKNGFKLVNIQEYFDDAERVTIPRILTLVLKR